MRRRLVWVQAPLSANRYSFQLFIALEELGFPAVSDCTAQGELTLTVRSFESSDASNYFEFTTAQTIIRNNFADIKAVVRTNQNTLGQFFDINKPSISIQYSGWIESISSGGTLINPVRARTQIRITKFVDNIQVEQFDDTAEVRIFGFAPSDPLGTRRTISGSWTG